MQGYHDAEADASAQGLLLPQRDLYRQGLMVFARGAGAG